MHKMFLGVFVTFAEFGSATGPMPEYVTIYAEDLSTQVSVWIALEKTLEFPSMYNVQFSQHISDVRSLAFAKRSHIGPQKR